MREGAAAAPPRRRVASIIRALEREYGRPRLRRRNRLKPLDELIATILSQNTSDTNSDRAWEALKARYPDWESVLAAPRRRIEAVIRPGGLAPTKSARIKGVLRKVKRDRGRLDLDHLPGLSAEEAEAYLLGFKGVGLKTVRCVLLFSCGMPVMPVDTHIHRVGKRLGIIPPGTGPDQAHRILQSITPEREIYPFHVNLITHGRRICRSRRPRCAGCVIASRCDHARAA